MGWSEFGRVRSEYNDEIKSLDEEILRIMNERKASANGKRFFPPTELIEEWSNRFEMEVSEIGWLINQLNDGSVPFYMPEGPGELLAVIQIMEKSTLDDFDYLLTHSMQHEHGSIVTLEINYNLKEDENIGHIIPHLMLEVTGPADYKVRRNGSHGGGGNTQVSFLVTPTLPFDLINIHFSLIPFASPMELPRKEVVLDKEVIFER
ncbi:hypothetical protein [Cytobacillus dafuensis]|uniref:Uncharacterized protein n=1 Tax=Cytobacillus dafuensis TaxID=1742359 RepID=A0A5B8Z136_CYTDA|nr:hypothetical protein [Cytobacillus dafuensis]QED46702.1 hypothetical protein FSZ17_05110 [Cytobacillus dafuensis]